MSKIHNFPLLLVNDGSLMCHQHSVIIKLNEMKNSAGIL
ncbi:hypothetical protein GPLA_4395 [Paraglaciecola polaris LMG 21857]|uniref:Uncharacterized protein n=1 Tax=Paraglaciecola polaris LMG 21857 TaxID=1129793 RepID=K6YRC5_9ALTE|nr:hypothetical protein GPLA_4395 [Paraglaciecola polaris LMG 21857]